MDEPRLFIAAASITVGLVAVGFSLIRRRFDRLLSFFAWFAVLYGARLWMKSDILRFMQHPSPFLEKVQMALNFFVAVPAFQFFAATGLIGRTGRVIAYAVCIFEMGLIAAIFLGLPIGPARSVEQRCRYRGFGFAHHPDFPPADGDKGRYGVSGRPGHLCWLCPLEKYRSTSPSCNND